MFINNTKNGLSKAMVLKFFLLVKNYLDYLKFFLNWTARSAIWNQQTARLQQVLVVMKSLLSVLI